MIQTGSDSEEPICIEDNTAKSANAMFGKRQDVVKCPHATLVPGMILISLPFG